MKTILKKLIFNDNFTRDDLIKRLMDGESFKYIKGTITHDLHYDKSHTACPFRLGTNAWDWRGLKYLHEEIEQKWWEDPEAKGKPVKVRDHETDDWMMDAFSSYSTGSTYRFRCFYNEYKYCQPLTADDLYQGDV